MMIDNSCFGHNEKTNTGNRKILLPVLLALALLISNQAYGAISTNTEWDEGIEDTVQWVVDSADQIGDIIQDSIDEVSQLREEQEAQERKAFLEQEQKEALKQEQIQKAYGRELLKAWDLMEMITDSTPWHIKVNQATCTVTIYRVLQVSKDALPFGEGTQKIEREAMQEAARLFEEAQNDISEAAETNSSSGAEDTGTDHSRSNGSGIEGSETDDRHKNAQGDAQEDNLTGSLHHIIRREFRHTDVPAVPSVAVFIPIYVCPCSVGADGKTPEGIFTLQDHLRWHELVGPTWGQWCCHFAPSYLFHSLPYDRPNDPNSLQTDTYNLIGQAASHGCVRLTAIDAKYIYDHVPSGAKVEIFTGTAENDPIDVPERPYVGEWDKTYDPTDPEYRPEA